MVVEFGRNADHRASRACHRRFRSEPHFHFAFNDIADLGFGFVGVAVGLRTRREGAKYHFECAGEVLFHQPDIFRSVMARRRIALQVADMFDVWFHGFQFFGGEVTGNSAIVPIANPDLPPVIVPLRMLVPKDQEPLPGPSKAPRFPGLGTCIQANCVA